MEGELRKELKNVVILIDSNGNRQTARLTDSAIDNIVSIVNKHKIDYSLTGDYRP